MGNNLEYKCSQVGINPSFLKSKTGLPVFDSGNYFSFSGTLPESILGINCRYTERAQNLFNFCDWKTNQNSIDIAILKGRELDHNNRKTKNIYRMAVDNSLEDAPIASLLFLVEHFSYEDLIELDFRRIVVMCPIRDSTGRPYLFEINIYSGKLVLDAVWYGNSILRNIALGNSSSGDDWWWSEQTGFLYLKNSYL